MRLSAKQAIFAEDIGKLICWLNCTYPNQWVTFGEAYRPAETARIYANKGIGIVDSLHTKRLAIDLHLFINSRYITLSKKYKHLGDYWESLNPSNRWGGSFSKPDGNHFERQP